MDDTKLINMPPASPLADDDVFYVVQGPGNDVPVDAKITTAALRSGLLTQDEVVEVPAGAIDGVNASFALSFVPAGTSLNLYKNGLLQEMDQNGDYTLSGSTITFTTIETIPLLGDKLRAVYRKGT